MFNDVKPVNSHIRDGFPMRPKPFVELRIKEKIIQKRSGLLGYTTT